MGLRDTVGGADGDRCGRNTVGSLSGIAEDQYNSFRTLCCSASHAFVFQPACAAFQYNLSGTGLYRVGEILYFGEADICLLYALVFGIALLCSSHMARTGVSFDGGIQRYAGTVEKFCKIIVGSILASYIYIGIQMDKV